MMTFAKFYQVMLEQPKFPHAYYVLQLRYAFRCRDVRTPFADFRHWYWLSMWWFTYFKLVFFKFQTIIYLWQNCLCWDSNSRTLIYWSKHDCWTPLYIFSNIQNCVNIYNIGNLINLTFFIIKYIFKLMTLFS